MTLLPIGVISLILHWILQPVRANSAQIFVTTSLENFGARIVEGWSGGGGPIWTIGNDSNHPFVGRKFAGAGRSDLKGTQIFGSGYPYGVVNNSTISGRPFPYGMWPIYWGSNTMGSDEYGPALDPLRPGGELVTIPVKTVTQHYNITGDETYYLIGDRDSALFMMISLVTSCHVTPAWPSKFDPTLPNSIIKIENVIQYYRASSFAIAFLGYTNAFALGNNTESTTSTPFPDIVTYSNFRRCIDAVILSALAIMNQPPEPKVSRDINIGGLVVVCLIIAGLVMYSLYPTLLRKYREEERKAEYRRQQARASRDARRMGFTYENYP